MWVWSGYSKQLFLNGPFMVFSASTMTCDYEHLAASRTKGRCFQVEVQFGVIKFFRTHKQFQALPCRERGRHPHVSRWKGRQDL